MEISVIFIGIPVSKVKLKYSVMRLILVQESDDSDNDVVLYSSNHLLSKPTW